MRSPLNRLLDQLLNHLVALGFFVFALIALVWWAGRFGPDADKAGEAVQADISDTDPVDSGRTAPPRIVAEQGAAGESLEDASPAQRPAHASDKPTRYRFRPPELGSEMQPDATGPGRRAITPGIPHTGAPKHPDRVLQQARQAFWHGAPGRAERHYLDYLAMRPAHADAFGELGNLYYHMGRPKDALDAYYTAGIRFREQGGREQLRQIVDLLRNAGDPRAAEFQR